MKKIFSTSKAPAVIGPYSQAVEMKHTLYVSGQIPINPESGKLVEGDISVQTEQVFRNIAAKELPLGALMNFYSPFISNSTSTFTSL